MRSTPKRNQRKRRGTLYLSVLGTATLVSIAGLCAMHVARTELRGASSDSDTTRARLAAEAGVAYALYVADKFPAWRTSHSSGVYEPLNSWLPAGDGEFKYQYDAGVRTDSTARNLNDDDAETITVRGIGRSGDSTSVVEATLINDGSGFDSLATSLASQGDILLVKPALGQRDLYVDQVVYSGANIDLTSGTPTIHGDAEAVGTVNNSITTNSETEGVAARTFPSSDAVFEYYKQRGTWIDVTLLSESFGFRVIDKMVLGPGLNQISGDTNPEGIYVIDCQNEKISISRSRIIGTLVLLNNHDDSTTAYGVSWSPVAENYPALMVENGFTLAHVSTSLLRESSINVSLNPTGAPYNGETDSDQVDEYASEINGLVYVGGQLKTFGLGVPAVNGVVLCNTARLEGDSRVNYRSVHFDSPPPGFADQGAMKVLTGSWRRGSN